MQPPPKPPLRLRIGAAVFGDHQPEPGPVLLCAGCRIAVRGPFWEHPFSHLLCLDTLEDYRRARAAQATRMREGKSLFSRDWTEAQQNYLEYLEESVRVLDALKSEELLRSDVPGRERREQLATATGVPLEKVTGLFQMFLYDRVRAQHYRQNPVASPKGWLALVVFGVALAVSVGAFVVAQWNDVVRALLTVLFYSQLGVLLAWFCLARFAGLVRRVFDSWFWFLTLALVLPGTLAVFCYRLLHDYFTNTLKGDPIVCFGAIALFWLVLFGIMGLDFRILTRRASREARSAIAAVPLLEPSQNPESQPEPSSPC